MAFGGMAHSPLASCEDGLGILPSAESGDLCSSVYSTASYTDYEARCWAKTMRTKEIEKSPEPHRFHLVDSLKKVHMPEPASGHSRRQSRWKPRENAFSSKSDYSVQNTDLYETGTDPYSLEFDMEERNETKRTAMEDFVTEAMSESFCPQASRPAQFYVPSPQTTCASFTLVHEHSTNFKHKHNSSDCDSGPMLDTSAHADYFPTDDDYDLYGSSASASLDGGLGRDDCMQRIDVPKICSAPSDLELSEPLYPHDGEAASSSRSFPGAMQVSDSTGSHNLPDSSLSTYSINSEERGAFTYPLVSYSSRSINRRATEGSFASLNLPSARERRFATRRQAIYAENGIQLAFPDSESESSLRQNDNPPGLAQPFTSSGSLSRFKSKGPGGKGHSARAASEYAFAASAPRSAWSVSTSTASLRSVNDACPAPDADDAAPRLPSLSDPIALVPKPATATLDLAQANHRLAGFSARAEDNSNSSVDSAWSPRMMDKDALLATSTPAQKTRPPFPHSRARSVCSARRPPHLGPSAPGGEREVVFRFPRTRAPGAQWEPLAIRKWDSTDPLVLCVPLSPRDRAERLELWMEDPDHHPIVEEMLRQVEIVIEEWNQPVWRTVPSVPRLYI